MGDPVQITLYPTFGATPNARGVPVTMNAEELATARGLYDRSKDATYLRNQSSALSAEVAARDWVKAEYGARAEVLAAVRRGKSGAPVFDYLVRTGRNEFVLLEAKAYYSELGFTTDTVFVADGAGGVRTVKLSEEVEQLSGKWVEQRIAELRRSKVPGAAELGNELDRSWRSGRLRVLEARAMPNARSTERLFEVVDYTDEANAYVGATGRHQIPPRSAVGAQEAGVKVRKGVTTVKSPPAQRSRLVERELLREDVKRAGDAAEKLRDEANTLKNRLAKVEARIAGQEKDLRDLTAKEAKSARKSPKTRAKLEENLDRLRAERDRLRVEAPKAHASAQRAESQAAALEGRLKKKKAEIAAFEATQPKRPIRPPPAEPVRPATGAPGKTSSAGGATTAASKEHATEAGVREARGVAATGTAERAVVKVERAAGAAERLVAAERGIARGAKVIKVAKTVFRLTKTVGKIAVALFVPLTPVEIAIELFFWLESLGSERREREAEWARITSYLFDYQRPVKVRFPGIYAPAAGGEFWAAVNTRLDDESDPENMIHWIKRWDDDRKLDPSRRFSGFVYAGVTTDLYRQEFAPHWMGWWNKPTTDYPLRYYLRGGLSRPAFFEKSSASMRWQKEIEAAKELPPGGGMNLFTAGYTGDTSDTDYLTLTVETKTLTVHAVSPSPCVTPFDILTFKVRDLFLEVVRYISKFDEGFLVAAPFEGSGVFVNWYDGVSFPSGIDGTVARGALGSLGKLLSALSAHKPTTGDKAETGFQRRLHLVNQIAPPNNNARYFDVLARKLNGLSGELGPGDYVKYSRNQDPALDYLQKDTLIQLAKELDEDFVRVGQDMLPSSRDGGHQYRYAGTLDP